jgi:Pentapeptide repeats (8 copies)
MASRLASSRLRTSVLQTVTSAGKRKKSSTSDSVARRSCSDTSSTPASASSSAVSARSIALSMIANRISCLDVTWLYRLGARTPRASAMSFIEVPRYPRSAKSWHAASSTVPRLAGPDLAGTDLAGTDLAGTDLAGTDLAGIDLSTSRSLRY